MLRKVLTLGMVFIFALSLLAVSMITCFTYDAEAHAGFFCYNPLTCESDVHFDQHPGVPWICSYWSTH